MSRLVYGFGINDADYIIKRRVNGKYVQCPFYARWKHMLERCYDSRFQAKHPTYIGCTLDPEWHSFMAFKAWMEQQNWQGKHLDKDILIPGNKVYGPDTCLFVSHALNVLLIDQKNSRGQWPRGVYFRKDRRNRKFRAKLRVNGRLTHLGSFDTPEEAAQCYQEAKASHVLLTAMLEPDVRVTEGLRRHADLIHNPNKESPQPGEPGAGQISSFA